LLVGEVVGFDVGAAVDFLVGDTVGPFVGGTVGFLVGDIVGRFVGFVVGRLVGCFVGIFVGCWDGRVVGFLVGDLVGFFVAGLFVPGHGALARPFVFVSGPIQISTRFGHFCNDTESNSLSDSRTPMFVDVKPFAGPSLAVNVPS
jgi:hypothetical protein